MKQIILFLIVTLSLQVYATKHHISASLGSNSYLGTQLSPWQTFKYACNNTNYPDSIYVMAGTYTVELCAIKAGVTVISDGASVVTFNVPYFSGDLVQMVSLSVNTLGQTINGITWDGQNIARGCLVITNRNNIIIEDCIFKNFTWNAVDFYNTETTPIVSNQIIRRCSFINASSYVYPGSPGALWIRGNKDVKIEYNYIECTYRSGDSAGFGLKMSYTQNVDSYKNHYLVPSHNDDLRSAFAIEANNNLGGSSFSYDTIEGIIDIAGRNTTKGVYDTAMSIHHCIIGQTSLRSINRYGIYLEANDEISDVYVHNNIIKNVEMALRFTPLTDNILQRIHFYKNLCTGIGRSGSNGWGYAIRCGTYHYPTSLMRDIYIDNNIIDAAKITNSQVTALQLPSGITAKNINIRNNIIIGFENSPILTVGSNSYGSIDSLIIKNNIIYNNGNINNPKYWGIVPTHVISSNNLNIDPLFVSTSNFNLQTISPAINAGTNIGLSYLGTAPDIGVYEFVASQNHAPIILNQVFTVEYNKPNNYVIGTILATDQDAEDIITITISGGNLRNTFRLDANTKILYVNNTAYMQTKYGGYFDLRVKAIDNTPLPLTSTAIIRVYIKKVK